MSEEQPPPAEPQLGNGSPLEHIIDDSEERAECREWIHREFCAGTDTDEILAELIASGWTTEDAESMVEDGRRATRHLRGVVTRDEVARAAEARYRRSMNIAPKLAAGGLLWVGVHFLVNLPRLLNELRRRPYRRPDDSEG
ncbi:MAG: hypothetical protein JWO87_1563 [Phycisphaerales bacterium]|nr:hypothetical protein [Phycisphaerales bacterium]MDB5299900.1 hypothetical protein [Phycisphaerales bacterium]MDB5304414.1 hypothetical protein [Phycisphaerales bacterium]